MVEIKLAETADVPDITRLLNKVTMDLHQRGINQWTYPWEKEEIERDIKQGNCYKLLNDLQLAGTFCMRGIDQLKYLNIPADSLYLAQIAILPRYQGKGAGAQIISFARTAAELLHKPLFLDCWAGNEKLKRFYVRNGFSYLGDYPEEDYFVSVFKGKKEHGNWVAEGQSVRLKHRLIHKYRPKYMVHDGLIIARKNVAARYPKQLHTL
ncbi:GNAT family N-acetyltransferase [Peribacillus deserti]|uniref:N-acetyltransferase n=1 Tax=Peribacillus deserti TaxID=673318 RepID=A0A2N5M8S8_9BACI|nr:GNAT family N-acetyltransferase [Peribacillus deserti]PLT30771.1 N-acetyltransferase [Peribacillus deserti]